jgi:hypothetical protein
MALRFRRLPVGHLDQVAAKGGGRLSFPSQQSVDRPGGAITRPVLVADQDLPEAPPQDQCGAQAGRSASDDQDIRIHVRPAYLSRTALAPALFNASAICPASPLGKFTQTSSAPSSFSRPSGSGAALASAPATRVPAELSGPIGRIDTFWRGTPHSWTTCSTASSALRLVSNSPMIVLSKTGPRHERIEAGQASKKGQGS